MADMKRFYKQKKKNAGISKPSSTKSKFWSDDSSIFGAMKKNAGISKHSLDSQENHDASEEVLRQFDLNMAYGPCVGMNRIERWNRAASLGLNPPGNIHCLLTSAAHEVCFNSLWDARV